jgi:hypothetical protein
MQTVLTAEIILQRGRIHAGFRRNVPRRGLVEAAFTKHPQRGIDDLRPRFIAAQIAADLRTSPWNSLHLEALRNTRLASLTKKLPIGKHICSIWQTFCGAFP